MTPAEPEEPAVKKKRKQRRAYAQRNLDKELQALTIAEPAAGDPPIVEETIPVVEQPTLQQEGKTEEDNPAEHQRVYAAAYAEGLRIVESPQAATPHLSAAEKEAARRARETERQRARRANAAFSQKERRRTLNAERQRTARAKMSESQREAVRERNRLAQRQRRGQLTSAERSAHNERNHRHLHAHREAYAEETREAVRQLNRERETTRRATQTEEEGGVGRETHRVREAHRRDSQNEAARDASRTRNQERQVARRAALTEEGRDEDRERNRTRRKASKYQHGLANQEDFRVSMVKGKNVVNGRHRLPPTTVCPLCNAFKWPDESAFICCMMGKVKLPPLRPAPDCLLELYKNKHFRPKVRIYNQAFAFTSTGASATGQAFRPVNQDRTVAGQQGVYTYRIQGAVGHYLGSMLAYVDPQTNQRTAPKFAQIYIVDPDMQDRARRRKGIFEDLDICALKDIEEMMQTCNPLARQFLTFGEKLRADMARGMQVEDIEYRLHPRNSRPGTHNLPTTSEVAAVVIEDGNQAQLRDICVYARIHRPIRLYETHSDYDTLQYPLMFPYGEPGWSPRETYANGATYRNKEKVSLRDYTAFRLFQKVNDQSALHQGGRLYQQYCVDQRAKCEQEQLRFIATHQKTIRAELYHGVRDAYLNEEAVPLGDNEALLSEYDRDSGTLVHPDRNTGGRDILGQIGKRIVVPSSFTEGPRNMFQMYQDSIAIVREYGSPDGFMTTTCSPKWEEILEKLPENQTAQDRPDIVAQVFNQKLRAQLRDLDEGILGRINARVYVVEYQKRGLPHAHIVMIVDEADKPRARHLIDKWVSAELPDKDVNPALFHTVMTCMMHGPCGAANPKSPCMKDGKCTKGYPKPLREVTDANVEGYPQSRRRRREPGVLHFNGKTYDNETVNQWVVPYNPYLCQKYDCHINLEVRTSMGVFKYLYKYITKGSDKAVMTIERVRGVHEPRYDPNEVLTYLNARYISPVEACMRTMGFEIQGKTHSVTTLTVHLEDCQMVMFCPTDAPEAVLERAKRSMLTSFFELCASEAPENQIAKTTLYQEIPKLFAWNGPHKRWIRRKKYQAAIGRIIHVSFRDRERYYLRDLLCHRKGPTSFADLRTVDGVVLPTFEAAATELGFIANDREWSACMSEAAAFRMPYQLRQLFATLLVYANVSNVRELWNSFSDQLTEDFAYKYRDLEGETKEVMVMFHTLKSLSDLLQINDSSVSAFDLPQLGDYPDLVRTSLLDNNLIRRELEGYDHSVLEEVDQHTDELNEGQRSIYDQIMSAVDQPRVARSFSSLMDRVARENPHCSSTSSQVFGYRIRQILPVVIRETAAETIDACLKSSRLWPHFRQVRLTENMRVKTADSETTAAEMAAFSEFLLQVGEGRHEVNPALGSDCMKIPRDMLIDNPPAEVDEDMEIAPGAIPSGLTRMIDAMYADVNNPEIATDEYFANRTILTTTNKWVNRINEAVGARLDGDAKEYLSVDAMEDDVSGNYFEQEFLNSVNINGIPPHKLTLKKGAPIMLMRNLNANLGLCNGTRLRVVELRDHVIYAKIMTGERRGQDVLIPKIVFISDGKPGDFPFRLRRKQFPVMSAFAMTINKAQGQTVQNLGLYLASPCFAHGQLYVALSRVTARSNIKILIECPEQEDEDGVYTANIVYKQIFDDA